MDSNKNNIFKLLIIIAGIVLLGIIVIKVLFSNDTTSVSVGENQTLVECSLDVNIAGEKNKTILRNYILENEKVIKVVSSETYYLNASSNNLNEEDINRVKEEMKIECDSYPVGECEINFDYKKNQSFRYDMILKNSLLNDLNNSILGLTEKEIIEKIKTNEEKNLLSCEVK